MALTPLHDRVLVLPNAPEETTAGGIIIPDTAKEKPQEGTIVATGNGKKTEDGKVLPLDVKTGDKVLYGKYGGTEITVDGKEMLIMRESDIYAVIS
ncbi:co-chaperone GroES [Candidatus Kapabacteria bacterium]|nr:co-chaperone GroES [Candidatus Kapabacteria bacterium]